MARQYRAIGRRAFIGGFGAAALILPLPARAQGLGLSGILGNATDNALDQLARPGAFYNGPDIRIGLPMIGNLGGSVGGILGTVLGGASDLGLLDGLVRKLNDGAGVAAGEAKPIFRTAIDDLSFDDVPGIVREKDGGTQYLRRSANDRLHSRLEPLVDDALASLGAHRQLDELGAQHSFIASAGLNRSTLNRTVTDQALDGIFAYVGSEEKKLRDNPLDALGGLLGL